MPGSRVPLENGVQLRPDLSLGIGILLTLILIVALTGAPRRHEAGDVDQRRSTYLSGPWGARGLSEALERVGIRVERHRRRLALLARPSDAGRSVVAVLDPSRALDVWDGAALLEVGRQGLDVLLAGPSANAAMRCFGYVAQPRSDSVAARPAGVPARAPIWVTAVLARTGEAMVVDSSSVADLGVAQCTVPRPDRVDTLLATEGGRAAALQFHYASGRIVTLIADGAVFGNRRMRDTEAGIFAMEQVAGRYSTAIFDEYHQGFGQSGSLSKAVVAWSLESPWGWAAWQLAAVGLLALLASGVRFGPVTTLLRRERRSPLEHVRALATALAAAHGQATAVRLIVRGLERRLSRIGRGTDPDPTAWLAALAPNLHTSKGRSALERLTQLTRGPERDDAVLTAAHAVEDVWEDLKP